MRTALLIFLVVLTITTSWGIFVTNFEWDSFKATYGKSYPNSTMEFNARFWYGLNSFRIAMFNNGNKSFRLGTNQYSDLPFKVWAARFPQTSNIPPNGVSFTPPNVTPQDSFSYAAQGLKSPIQDQGSVCNSGWAYVSAAAIQIFSDSISGNLNSAALSAQNLIDCAGGPTSCSNQKPQTAFDFLTVFGQKLFPESEYRNNPTGGKGMCVLPVASTSGQTLKSYSNIPDGNDSMLKLVVNYIAPVIIKINPASFAMMFYAEGLMTVPESTIDAAHYVLVVGYGVDKSTGEEYFIIQNSFGSTWGESGYMRIKTSSVNPIAKSAIFPLE